MNKEPYLVVYDYGMGGVWAVVYANNKKQIIDKYPMLDVVDERPSWMTEDLYEKTRANRSFDADDAPCGWLLTVVNEQSKGP